MTQFVTCVENLVAQCRNTSQALVLDRLVNPNRVKAALPILCERQDDILASGECMNKVMGQDSECKNQAYEKIKTEMSKSMRNVTATFYIQCSFFNSLAACQRDALSESCGHGLGELHAQFLLSFIPSSCAQSYPPSAKNKTAPPSNDTGSDVTATTTHADVTSGSTPQTSDTLTQPSRKTHVIAKKKSGNTAVGLHTTWAHLWQLLLSLGLILKAL
ncbi:uncharacterized protein LOC131934689 [Physella acuta]|uniref:uncharacterized protein LOC131934689 n=1 Tax=Physella acuta TaxID=109671 RepID=UPI0027DE6DC6|nr:uncharacterized protein LOC131934689 [Physella acuta]